MKGTLGMMTAMTFVAFLTAHAAGIQDKTQTSKQAAKADAASVAGKWSMALDTPHGKMTIPIDIKLDGKKVTGTFSSEQTGPAPIAGEYVDGKLSFAVDGGAGDLKFTGKLKDKDTLVGDLSSHMGDLPCTATRVKEK
jgi:hypothetical protein